MKVIIVRDRESAGGGIHNYYRNLAPFFTADVRFQDVGKAHHFFGGRRSLVDRSTSLRLLVDWFSLLVNIITFRPDIVHVNPGLDATSCRALRRDAVNLLLGRMFGRKLVVFWRGWESAWIGNPCFPRGNKGWIYEVYQRASAQIVLASRFKRDLRNWGFEMPIHVETTVADQGCVEAGGKSPVNGAQANLLFLSRVDDAKGVFELVDAYQILRGRGHRCCLTIAGDGPALEALKAHVAKSGVEDVRFPGYVSGDQKLACYREGTIFCFPSSHGEGMPNAVLEAMAAGLPVIASKVGGLEDILEAGKTGGILDELEDAVKRRMFDPEAIADAVEPYLSNPELYARVSAHNVAYARKRFAPQKVAARLEGIYREVIGKSV